MYEIEFTDDEICTVLNALDFYSRIWIGQYDHILWELRWIRSCRQLDVAEEVLQKKLLEMRNIILPGLYQYSLYGSYGIFSPERNVKAAIAYDMQQEFRYRRAWFKNPNGGITVDFGRPLPCDDDPCEFPKAECYQLDSEFRIKIWIDQTQLDVIVDALKIIALGYSCQLGKMFEYYTENQSALKIAQEITDLMTEIEIEHLVETEKYYELADRLECTFRELGGEGRWQDIIKEKE